MVAIWHEISFVDAAKWCCFWNLPCNLTRKLIVSYLNQLERLSKPCGKFLFGLKWFHVSFCINKNMSNLCFFLCVCLCQYCTVYICLEFAHVSVHQTYTADIWLMAWLTYVYNCDEAVKCFLRHFVSKEQTV